MEQSAASKRAIALGADSHDKDGRPLTDVQIVESLARKKYSQGYNTGVVKQWNHVQIEIDKLKEEIARLEAHNITLMNNQVKLMSGDFELELLNKN
jgi:hypothetical protein